MIGAAALARVVAAAVLVVGLADSSRSPTTTSVPHEPQPVGRAGDWSLVFDDEFDEKSLDEDRWVTAFPWGRYTETTPNTVYRPDNVAVADGRLVLRASIDERGERHYASGLVTSGDGEGSPPRFTFQYGYAEMRARLPSGQGLWPAFWLLPPGGRWPPEIDVVEKLGSDPTTIHMFVHYLVDGEVESDGDSYSGPDFSDDFHVFAVEWTPEAIRWFVDGVERRAAFTETAHIPAEPMYLVLTLYVGGSWPGEPDQSTPLPAEMEVDYVRVWQDDELVTGTIHQ